MPQLIQTIDAFEHNRCRCSIPPCCIEKRSMNLAEKLSAPPEIDSAGMYCQKEYESISAIVVLPEVSRRIVSLT